MSIDRTENALVAELQAALGEASSELSIERLACDNLSKRITFLKNEMADLERKALSAQEHAEKASKQCLDTQARAKELVDSAFQRGVDSAARLAAANGIDLREYLNLSPETEKEIEEALAKRQPVSLGDKCPACESPGKWGGFGHAPWCKAGEEEIHTSSDCKALPPHKVCWEDASGMNRWKT